MSKFLVNSKKLNFQQNSNTKMLSSRSVKPIPFTVSFDSCGGSSVLETQQYNVGDTYDLLPATSHPANKFKGWTTSKSIVKDGDYVDYYSPVLSAIWISPTEIAWDATTNGGTLDPTTGMHWYIGEPFEVLPTAQHSDQTLSFKGWYTSADGGTKIGVSDIFTGQLTTYYAQFTAYDDPIGNVICPTQNITFSTSQDYYPWILDSTTGVSACKCCQDIYTNDGYYSILEGHFTGSGTLQFDVYCDTESHYDGMYVLIDNVDSFYMKWSNVFDWDGSEYGSSGAVFVDGTWVFSGDIGWTYNCQMQIAGSGDHSVQFVYGNDCNDGSGSGDYFDKSAVLVANVRFS